MLAVVALLVGSAAGADAADVQAQISSREAYVGAPLQLRLMVANASSHEEPEVPSVPGLDIRMSGTPSQSTQTTIINGRRTDRSSTIYTWQITPRQAGTFQIPPINVEADGKVESTRPIRFVATKSETGDLLFAEITGQQKEIYVGQPLTLTLNLWIKPYHNNEYDLTLSEENMWQMISSGTNWGAFSERMTELAENRQRPGGEEVLRKDSNGNEGAYYQYQIEATIYPKRPGQIEADDLQIVVDYPTKLAKSRDPFSSMFDDDFFGGRSPFGDMGMSPFRRNTLSVVDSRPVVADAEVAPIDVKPIPTAGRPSDYRGAVGHYQIITQATPDSVKAGDPITLHIGVRGDGPMELVQAPPLAALPQLTKDFKVANEPLAGIVQDDTKLFTTTIRPKRAGITQIPAIPLSYFDPTTEKFVTVESDPIAIHVDPAERLALDAIVGNSNGNAASPNEEANAQPTFNLTNYDGNDAVVSTGSSARWPWMMLALLPPLAVGLVWRIKRKGSIFSTPSTVHRQRIQNARRAVADAVAPRDIATALGGLNQQTRPTFSDAQRRDFDELLAECDHAAYAGGRGMQLPVLKEQAMRILNTWPADASAASSHERTSSWGGRRAIAVACLVLAAATVAVPASIHFASQKSPANADASVAQQLSTNSAAMPMLSEEQKATILDEANRAYAAATKAMDEDAAAANEGFATAAMKYQQLVDDGVENSHLFANLANAQLQLGSTGKAIANYERALSLDPSNSKARGNLAATRAAVDTTSGGEDTATSLSGLMTQISATVHSFVTPTVANILLAAAWVALWMVVLGWMISAIGSLRWAWIPVACLLVMGVLMFDLPGWKQQDSPRAIVATNSAMLREAPGKEFPQVAAKLNEGESVNVLKVDGEWLQIATPEGSTGWINRPDVEVVGRL